ncbi:DUF2809 domain-containing protein [Caulobacter sp. FWC2]|uniref:ribosomal maturation YjgA family protein n=1 Tax=Caulobacter sp. FWC2 TaxID=69664 RepID=UPI000C151232|nr:DUF2809 domain-containing protein [Caulobacter sp. FWC2]PIB90865.1 hypothetical protein CSW62_04355 [Caulobacter sp. FWC2]
MTAGYALLAGAIFLIEVVIALWWRDGFVRPYLGDVLAVVLVYLALRATTRLDKIGAAGVAFAIAVAIELGQLIHVLDAVGLAGNRLARVVLGGVFDPADLLCYLVGAVVALVLDLAWLKRSSAPGPG